MFGSVGGAELILLLVLALLVFGPRRLPKIGRKIGSALSEFRRATTDFKMNLEREVDIDEVRSAGREIATVAEDARSLARGSLHFDPGKQTSDRAAGTGAPPGEPSGEGQPDSSPDGAEPRS